MLLLTDECLHADIVAGLRRAKHDVHHVGETHQSAADEVVLSLSVAENRIIVTDDKDFGDLVIRRRMPVHGIVLLRLTTSDPLRKLLRLLDVLEGHADRVVDHHVVIDDSTVRTRPLLRTL